MFPRGTGLARRAILQRGKGLDRKAVISERANKARKLCGPIQGLLYARCDFMPKKIAKIRTKTHFNTNKSGVVKIPCAI